jgi:hypothetical protein
MKRFLPFLVLMTVAGCGADDPIPTRLKARLESVLDSAHKEPTPDELREALLRQLRQAPPGAGPASSPSTKFPSPESIRDFYAKRDYHFAWSDEAHGPIAETATLFGALHRAGEHGLVPDEYAVDRLEGPGC